MYDFWPYLSFALGIVVIILGVLLGIIRLLGHGWVRHIDTCLKDLYQKHDEQKCWCNQQHTNLERSLGKIEGKLNERKNV